MLCVEFVLFGTPVTTLRAVTSSATGPTDVAPAGAANVAVNVTPTGMLALICAVIRYVLFAFGVVTV